MAFNSSHFTSISDVDDAVRREVDRVLNGSPTPTISSKPTSFEDNILTASPDLARLLVLKELYRRHIAVEDKFRVLGQLNRATRSNSDCLRWHLEGFRSAFEEITNRANPPLLPALSQGTHFLDLGCAPGGSATWLLQNTSMQGVGITLAWPQAKELDTTKSGATEIGIPLHSDIKFFELRFSVLLRDLLQVATGTSNETIPAGSVPANGFDLIIANAAIPLASRAKKILLIFAQLLLSFQHIKAGGALIVSLPTRPFVWVIDVVATLKHTFQFVDAVKPAFQAKTSFAYFVCQGFRAVEATKQQYIHRLCSRIYYLKEADEQGFEFDTSKVSCLYDASYKLSHSEVIKLFTAVWKRQYNAIHTDYERVLNSHYDKSGFAQTGRAGQSTGHTSMKGLHVAELPATQPREPGSSNWRDRTAALQHDGVQTRRKERDVGFKKLFAHGSGASNTDSPWRTRK